MPRNIHTGRRNQAPQSEPSQLEAYCASDVHLEAHLNGLLQGLVDMAEASIAATTGIDSVGTPHNASTILQMVNAKLRLDSGALEKLPFPNYDFDYPDDRTNRLAVAEVRLAAYTEWLVYDGFFWRVLLNIPGQTSGPTTKVKWK